MTNLKVGDEIRFDHFGGKDRLGKVVRVTSTAILVEWMAPSSGKVRVVRLRHEPYPPRRHEVLQPGVERVSDITARGERQMAKTRKVTLTRWYTDGTIEVTEHPSKAAAERTLESHYADGVFPYIRDSRIERTQEAK